MLQYLIHRPIAVIMSFLGAIALGLVVAGTLPVGLLPEVPIPRITVQIAYPNTSARELEDAVVRPLRQQLLQVGRLADIRSRTRNNAALITLDFDFGVDTDLAFIEVNEKIDQAAAYLPRDLDRPRVVKANVADVPVLHLSLIPKAPAPSEPAASPLELSDFARAVVRRRIEQLPQVAFVDISGYAEPELAVVPRAEALHALGLSSRDLERVILDNNLELGGILVQDGQYQYNVRFRSALGDATDVAGLYFNHGGRLLQLCDVAEVRLRPREARGQYLYDGRPAIVFTVRKQADARLFDLQRDFIVLLADLRAQYPQLEFAVTHDQSELLRVSVQNLLSSLGYGALFAFLILFAFFREWRAPVFISIAVPLALVMALLGFYLAGLSINVISLAGLILGVGLMVDNSIIVIENIRQHRATGLPLTEACVRGGEEVIRPLLSSALTTCSVFLPMVFLSGIAGALFYDQALAIAIALAASLLAAYGLLPVLVRVMGRRGDGDRGGQGDRKKSEIGNRKSEIGNRRSERELPGLPGEVLREEMTGKGSWKPEIEKKKSTFYYRSVDLALRYRWVTLLLFVAFMVLGYFALGGISHERFPRLTRPALEATIDWNEPVDLSENRRRVEALLARLGAQVTTSSALIGEQQFLLSEEEQALNEATLTLYQSAQPLDSFQREVSALIRAAFPRAAVTTRPLRNLFDEIFGAERPPLVAHLQATRGGGTPAPADVAPLRAYLAERGVATAPPPRQEHYAIRVDREAALRYEVEIEQIYRTLKTLFRQNNIGELRGADHLVPIVLGAEVDTFHRLLEEAGVENRRGDRLPLRAFLRTEREEAYKELDAGRAGETLTLALPRYDTTLVTGMRDFLRREGRLTVYFSGQYYDNRRLLRELAVVMTVSLLLLYLILAAQFESLVQPLIVLLTVPAGLSGALLTLWAAGESLNLVALIGMVVMSGIVVNDAILKVDMINRLRQETDLLSAIHGAGARRLRPILMTSLTTVLALTPVLLSAGLGAELQRPLAWTVIGGLTTGTIASLYVTPVLYALMGKNR